MKYDDLGTAVPAKTVYLAGKIGKNDWRHRAVDGLRGAWGSDADDPGFPWPVLRGAVGGTLDYAGPYPTACDHGCWHRPTSHGCAGEESRYRQVGRVWFGGGCGGAEPAVTRTGVRDLCLDAIDRSDLVYAWIDDPTAFGTLAEIGYARGLGKKIIIAAPEPPEFGTVEYDIGDMHDPYPWAAGAGKSDAREMWFAFSLADAVLTTTDPAATVLEIARQGK